MKKLLSILLFIFVMTNISVSQDLNEKWSQFEKELSLRQPVTAGKTLDEIEKLSKNDSLSQLRCVLRRVDVLSLSSDDFENDAISFLESKKDEKSIVNQVFVRLALADLNVDVEENMQFIEKHLNDLKNISIQPYVDIIDPTYKHSKYDPSYEPTLFSYFIHKTIEYQQHNVIIDKNIDPKPFFKVGEDFRVATPLNFKRLVKLYKEQIREDIKTKDYSLLVFDEMSRLSYFYSLFDNDSLCLKALETLGEKFDTVSLCQEILALRMIVLMKDEEYEQAMQIYSQTTSKNKNFDFTVCKPLVEKIEQQEISFELQQIVCAGQNIPAKITYRNIENCSYTISKITEKEKENLDLLRDDNQKNVIKNKPILRKVDFSLTKETDYHLHSTLVALEPLEPGLYVIYSEINSTFEYFIFRVTEMASYYENLENQTVIYVKNRFSGEKMQGVNVSIYQNKYDYKTHKDQKNVVMTTVSDEEGRVKISNNNNSYLYYDLTLENDTLPGNSLDSYSEEEPKEVISTRYFLDRAIYRAGQEVHFAGVAYKKKGDDYAVVSGMSLNVDLYDANGEKIATKAVVSDDFGSFTGYFTLPEGRLNGQYHIYDGKSSKYFTVEDYKRPSYEILISEKDVKEVNGERKFVINGQVKAFSGFGMSHSQVDYKVERLISYPWYIYWRPMIFPFRESTVEWCEGTVHAKTDGSFVVEFPAAEIIKEKDFYRRVLNTYKITIKTTDQQGETHEETVFLRDSETPYDIVAPMSETINIDELKDHSFKVVEFLSEKPAATTVKRSVYRLNTNDKPKGFFKDLDRKVLSDKELSTLFDDFDYYQNNDDKGELIYEDEVKTGDDGLAQFLPKKCCVKAGRYRVVLEIEGKKGYCEKTVTVFDESSKKLIDSKVLKLYVPEKIEPNQTINIAVGGAIKKGLVFVEIYQKGEKRLEKMVKINKDNKFISYKTQADDDGLLTINAIVVWHNTIEYCHEERYIPSKKDKISLVLHSEREVLAPGEDVNWTVEVKNADNQSVKANVFATMYDASLDQFVNHSWNAQFRNVRYFNRQLHFDRYHNTNSLNYSSPIEFMPWVEADRRLLSQRPLINMMRRYGMKSWVYEDRVLQSTPEPLIAKKASNYVDMMEDAEMEEVPEEVSEAGASKAEPTLRENFNELAFFVGGQSTEEGKVAFHFTMPDAITRWKILVAAYTQELRGTTLEQEFTTSLPLMIMSDMPRFVYQNDTVVFTANVINLSEDTLSASAKVEIFDAETNEIQHLLTKRNEQKVHDLLPGESRAVKWRVPVKTTSRLLKMRFSVKDLANTSSDAESHVIPVLSDKVLVQKSAPLEVKKQTTKTLTFDELLPIGKDETIEKESAEVVINPAFAAVQALPCFTNDDEEQITSLATKFFANALASYLVANTPNIDEKIKEWQSDEESLLSNLEKNKDVKAILLEATPWVAEARDEREQRAKVAELLKNEEMQKVVMSQLSQLSQRQTVNGGWAWIKNMPESEYVTTKVLLLLSRYQKLTNSNSAENAVGDEMNEILEKGMKFLKEKIVEQYQKDKEVKKYIPSTLIINELYVLSYSNSLSDKDISEALNFFITKMKKNWRKYDFYTQAEIAMVLHRIGEKNVKSLIIKSLRECAWRGTGLEVRMIEAFSEMTKDKSFVDELRGRLLSKKQRFYWESSALTAEAIYALLLGGDDWLNDEEKVSYKVQNSSITVENKSKHAVYGSVYRSVFVDVDKLAAAAGGVKISREIIALNDIVKVGDKIEVKITIDNAQDLEFVALRDFHSAAVEAVEQLSGYEFTEHLFYLRSNTDVATTFYFEVLPKGRYTVSYELYVTKEGSFAAGYSHLQSLYAPEFSAFSEGARMKVIKKK